jgi:molybdate transport system substrate-binding protein
MMWGALSALGLISLVAGAAPLPARAQSHAQEGDVVIFAAASLKNALDAVNAQWQKETGKKATISYASSPALAKQIEQGAPAQMFISADLDWMDYLQQKNLIDTASRRTLLGNTLVLVAPKDSTVSLPIEKNFALIQALGADGKLAMAGVDSVPAGKYGKAALTFESMRQVGSPHAKL